MNSLQVWPYDLHYPIGGRSDSVTVTNLNFKKPWVFPLCSTSAISIKEHAWINCSSKKGEEWETVQPTPAI